MSTNSKTLTSTSDVAIAAAYKPDVQLALPNIPSLGSAPGAADANTWHEATKTCAGEAITFADKKRDATRQTFAMIVMDTQLHTYSFYETKLKEAGLGLPQKKETLTYGIAWHLKLDVSDANKKIATDNSKTLNRLVSAGQRLIALGRKELGIERGQINVSYDAKGVTDLLKIVIREGGINAMALANGNIVDDKLKSIVLSSDRLASRREGLLIGRGEIVLAVTKPGEDENAMVTQPLSLPPEAMVFIYPQLKLADPRIRFLAELFAIGEAVVEEKTDHLVNPETDDPNDAYAARRVASRQYVFHPDGKMTVSPILRDTSVVIVVEPKLDLLDVTVEGHIKFQTFGRRRAAINIAGARQDAFDFEWADAAETEGVGRIKLTTPAASFDADKLKDVGLLIEHVRSKQGNLPLIIDPVFSPKIDLGSVRGLLDKMDAVSQSAKKMRKNDMSVKVTAEAEKLSFSGYSKTEAVQIDAVNSKARVDVRPDDFFAVTAAIKTVEVHGDFSVAIDPDMLVISFKTEFAHYSIHIPSALQKMVRSNRHIMKLDPVAWPEPQAVAGADADAGENTSKA
ncbi:hypothetical protein [Rhizobium sp. Leaf262]|uniref:hypothetical protein n=1 Tax=Rhizobium sp. Leaf262 TaxID=1736312 RepID=UPI000715A7A2|nr:hypothetical protein [Rhizobium sp. Leaf262]KQO79010.1 hypothetical protein ASF29_04625 [Rhizobium sp. Leaf262]